MDSTIHESREAIVQPPKGVPLHEDGTVCRDQFSEAVQQAEDFTLHPFMSLRVSRPVMPTHPEESDLLAFQYMYAHVNNGIDQETQLLRVHPDPEQSWIIQRNALSVTVLGATAVASIIARHISDDGRIERPAKLQRVLKNAAGKIDHHLTKQNDRAMERLSNDYHVRHTVSEAAHEQQQLLSGQFRVARLGAYGLSGATRAFEFDDFANDHIKRERDDALQILLEKLHIRSLDRDIEDLIRSSIPHLSIMRLGFDRDDLQAVHPTTHDFDINSHMLYSYLRRSAGLSEGKLNDFFDAYEQRLEKVEDEHTEFVRGGSPELPLPQRVNVGFNPAVKTIINNGKT